MEEQTIKCILCDQIFPNRSLLQQHFRTHAGNLGSELKAKKKLSVKSKPDNVNTDGIQCDECSEVFANTTKAITHKYKKHPDSKSKNFCPWCGMLFPLKHIMNIHLKTHSDNDEDSRLELHCEECEVDFYNNRALKYHNSSFHYNTFHLQNVTTAPPSNKIYINGFGDVQSLYYCHLCGNEYVTKYNLRKHIQQIHENDESNPDDYIKCKMCDALFFNLKAYEFHNTFHKPDDLYVTSEQMRKQVVTKIDQDFDFRRIRVNHLSSTRKMKYSPEFLNEQMKYAEAIKNSLPQQTFEEAEESTDSVKSFEVPIEKADEKPQPKQNLNAAKPAMKVISKDALEKMKSQGLISIVKAPKDIKNLQVVKVVQKPMKIEQTEAWKKVDAKNKMSIRKAQRHVRNFVNSNTTKRCYLALKKQYLIKECFVKLTRL